jgi:hypothetical protein
MKSASAATSTKIPTAPVLALNNFSAAVAKALKGNPRSGSLDRHALVRKFGLVRKSIDADPRLKDRLARLAMFVPRMTAIRTQYAVCKTAAIANLGDSVGDGSVAYVQLNRRLRRHGRRETELISELEAELNDIRAMLSLDSLTKALRQSLNHWHTEIEDIFDRVDMEPMFNSSEDVCVNPDTFWQLTHPDHRKFELLTTRDCSELLEHLQDAATTVIGHVDSDVTVNSTDTVSTTTLEPVSESLRECEKPPVFTMSQLAGSKGKPGLTGYSSSASVRKHFNAAGAKTAGRGQRGFPYGLNDVVKMLREIVRSAGPYYQNHARKFLEKLAKEYPQFIGSEDF